MKTHTDTNVRQDESVAYAPGPEGKDMLFPGAAYPDDFKIAHGWWMAGAKYPGQQALQDMA